MALEDLYDHRIRIWRPTASRGPLREETRSYAIVLEPPSIFNATVRRPTARLANPGPGLAPVGERKVYCASETPVQARDVVELVSGPEAPSLLEVDEPPTRPRGHHTELTCRFFVGAAPTEDGS